MEIIKTRLEMSEAECPRCGTTLRYWPSEIKTDVLPGYAGSYYTRPPRPLYDYISCPLCGERIIITRYEIPRYKHEEIKSENQKDFWQRLKQWLTKR